MNYGIYLSVCTTVYFQFRVLDQEISCRQLKFCFTCIVIREVKHVISMLCYLYVMLFICYAQETAKSVGVPDKTDTRGATEMVQVQKQHTAVF